MPFQAACPGCRVAFTLADEFRGRKMRCSRCQQIFTADDQPRPSASVPPPAPAAPAAPAARPPAPTGRPAPPPTQPAAAVPDKTVPMNPSVAARPQPSPPPAAAIQASPASPSPAAAAAPGAPEAARADRWQAIRQRGNQLRERTAPVVQGFMKKKVHGYPMPLVAGGAATALLFFTCGFCGLVWSIWPSKDKPAGVADAGNTINNDRPPTTANRTPPPTTNRESPPPPPANGQLAPEVLRRVKGATVHLRVTKGNGSVGEGSGFFAVERGIVLTNAHVVGMLDPESPPPESIEGTINSGDVNEKKFTGSILGVDRNSDLAVLRAVPAAGVAELPAPLEVKSALNLIETQQVFVFGFPLGTGLGKEITISRASVTSFRKDKETGLLRRVQVDSGIEPGNSGGPVVDARGDVVGVAVSIIIGTQLKFAVPGDQVSTICNGRVSSMSIGQPYLEAGKTSLPVTMFKIDPLGRMRDFALEVWAGDPGKARPASVGNAPPAQAGDGPRFRQGMENRAQVATGEVFLPPLPPGKVYWVQPRFVDGSGQTRWTGASVFEMKSPPVERKPAMLTLKHQAGERPVTLTAKRIWKLTDADGEQHTLMTTMDTHVQETTQGVNPDGSATIRLQYRDFTMGQNVDDQPRPRNDRTTRIMNNISNLVPVLTVDRSGQLVKNQWDITRVQPTARKDVLETHDQIQQSLEAMGIPWPNKEVAPRTSWRVMRALPIDTFGNKFQTGALDMTYTYLGTRMRDGRAEAVIGMTGQVRGRGGDGPKVGGREGTAVLDLAAGQVSMVDAKVLLDVDIPLDGRPGRANGVLEVKVQRNVK